MVWTMSQILNLSILRQLQRLLIQVSFNHWVGWPSQVSLVDYLITIRQMTGQYTVILRLGWQSLPVIDM